MENLIGKKFLISGMTIEVVSEDEEQYVTQNITTRESIIFDKAVLEYAIKLGKVEEVTDTKS